jgi:hypothetical protein
MRLLAFILAWLRRRPPVQRTAPPGAPHGGERTVSTTFPTPPGATEPPPCGAGRVSPQDSALSGIVRVWKERATTAQQATPATVPARVLACQFRSCLQSEPALVGWRIPRKWVQSNYPIFCRALNVAQVPYKDFANELAEVMPRKRLEKWSGGKRLWTHRYYLVQDPATSVVEIADHKRA